MVTVNVVRTKLTQERIESRVKSVTDEEGGVHVRLKEPDDKWIHELASRLSKHLDNINKTDEGVIVMPDKGSMLAKKETLGHAKAQPDA